MASRSRPRGAFRCTEAAASVSKLRADSLARRQEVLAALERHDGGGKGYLTREEFTSAAQDIFACVSC